MLCKVCTNIFDGGTQAREYKLESIGVEHGRTVRYTHHPTTRSLIDSAGLSCYICTKVLKDALSRGFTRGPALSWQKNNSTSFVLQTLDRHTLSVSALELLCPNESIFWTKFILEPVKPGALAEDFDEASNNHNTVESTGSDTALDLASKWISDCVGNHNDCIQPGSLSKQLPTRLLKVGGPESSLIHLYEGNDFLHESDDILNPVNERYMTLSHCWGKARILTLTKSTYEKLKSGVNDSELPQTFRDAVHFTRRLRINYIWIDSLCIFQDSTDDWLKESSAMTKIYQQAFCNISALASSSTDGGCFRERDSRSIKPCTVNARWEGLPRGTLNIYHKMLWQNDIAKAPLHKRAWVVQERLLAPRVLHFGREQLFWECHTMNACETYPAGLPQSLSLFDPSINFKGLSPSIDGENLRKLSNWDCSDSSLNQLYVWEKIVKTYTSCALTRDTDKLIGISGIAKRVKPLSLNASTNQEGKLASYSPAKYLAGLWDFFLPAQLLWEVQQGSRPSTYRAPSWSWASLDGQVSFCDAFNDGEDHIKILNCTTTSVSEDPFGQISDGKIQLEGYPALLSATISKHDTYYVISTDDYILGAVCRSDVIDDQPNGCLYCLPMRTYRKTTEHVTSQRLGCLILAPTRNRGEFSRWAQMTLENESEKKAIQRARGIHKRHFSDQEAPGGKYTMIIV